MRNQAVTLLENLPSEVIVDILVRLPLSSVVQFWYVRRSWRVFPRMHLYNLRRSLNETDREKAMCLILQPDKYDDPIPNELYFVEYPSNYDGTKIAQKKINNPLCALMPEFVVVSSLDGILCLADAWSNVALYLYNPLTRDYIELPKCIEYPNADDNVIYGFGFSPIAEVYKIVKITYYKTDGPVTQLHFRLYPANSIVEIFTTGRPLWRSIGNAPHFLEPSPAQILVNGRLHWVTWTPMCNRPHNADDDSKFISFDLVDEQFREVPVPKSCFGPKRGFVHLLAISGCLGAACFSRPGNFEIWILKEYGVSESWVKEWNICRELPPALREADKYQRKALSCVADEYECVEKDRFIVKRRRVDLRVLNVSESGHILLYFSTAHPSEDDSRTALVLYDSNTRKFTEIEFEGMPKWFQLVVHEARLNQLYTLLN